ncbi:MAG: hypothetical protein RLZZ450_4335 [Pseudomonadota bacterium]|jgi:SAM-dependent methyltransferase
MAKRDLKVGRTVQRGHNHGGLRQAAVKVIDRRVMGSGSVALPCVPALLDSYVERLCTMWTALGRTFSASEREQLREGLAGVLRAGFEHSPHTLMVVNYEARPAPKSTLAYTLQLQERSVESYYEAWAGMPAGAHFGKHADAMVLALARQLTPGAHVLDVGAGHGRNSVPLCKLGLKVDALEPVESLCDEMRAQRARAALELSVIRGDLLDPELELASERYQLVILSEIVSHFRDSAQLQGALAKLSAALARDGLLAMNVFVCDDGYTPEALVRQAAQVALSSSFTRSELLTATQQLPLGLLRDEPALDYERDHVPPEAWPPTPWFEGWSEGRNIFDVPGQVPPIRLRWLVYQKRGTS